MATKKLTEKRIKEMITLHQEGKSPADLALIYKVHPTTIRRYLRESGVKSDKPLSHVNIMGRKEKNLLRRLLVEGGVSNIDSIVSKIDESFNLSIREQDTEFEIIQLEE